MIDADDIVTKLARLDIPVPLPPERQARLDAVEDVRVLSDYEAA